MRYYSKSPTDLRDEAEKRSEKKGRRLKTAHIILLADIIIIVLLLFYFMGRAPTGVTSQKIEHTAKDFPWQGWQITAQCNQKRSCTATLALSAQSQSITNLEWRQMESGNDQPIFKAIQNLSLQKGTSNHSVTLPDELNSGHQLFVRLLNGQDEKLIFRVFP